MITPELEAALPASLTNRSTPQPERFPTALDIRAIPRWDIHGQPSFACPNVETWNPFKRAAKVQLYTLLSDFVYISERLGTITVPAGAITDFGSVPALAKFYVDDDDPDLLFGSIVHDDFYKLKGHLRDGRIISRHEADMVLREAMLACGAPTLKANIVFEAVRTGGRGTWNEP